MMMTNNRDNGFIDLSSLPDMPEQVIKKNTMNSPFAALFKKPIEENKKDLDELVEESERRRFVKLCRFYAAEQEIDWSKDASGRLKIMNRMRNKKDFREEVNERMIATELEREEEMKLARAEQKLAEAKQMAAEREERSRLAALSSAQRQVELNERLAPLNKRIRELDVSLNKRQMGQNAYDREVIWAENYFGISRSGEPIASEDRERFFWGIFREQRQRKLKQALAKLLRSDKYGHKFKRDAEARTCFLAGDFDHKNVVRHLKGEFGDAVADLELSIGIVGDASGTIIDKRTGEEIEGANVKLFTAVPEGLHQKGLFLRRRD